MGAWADHLYADQLTPNDLDQFGPGVGGSVELGLQGGHWLFSLRTEFCTLATGEWVDFAREQGSDISASAYLFAFHAVVGIRFASLGPVHFDGEVGLGYAQAFGQETDEHTGHTFEYSFTAPTLSLRQSLAVSWRVSRYFDLVLALRHTIGLPYGVDYEGADRQEPLWGLGLGLGVRLWTTRATQGGQ